MSWEALTAVGTVLSALVVAVAAIAAVVQIRHLRAANQLEAILGIYESFNSNEMVLARRYCANDLPALLKDPTWLSNMKSSEIDPRVTFVGNFFNEIGALLVDGFLDERLVRPLVPTASQLWSILSPIALEWRKHRTDPVWADFEYLAALAERTTRATYVARFPAWFRARLTPDGS
jgi:hypothetical protein